MWDRRRSGRTFASSREFHPPYNTGFPIRSGMTNGLRPTRNDKGNDKGNENGEDNDIVTGGR